MNTEDILHKAFEENNVLFLTGPGGTGKTYAINRYIEKHCQNLNVAITASTGIAATHIDGQTIHRFTGIGQHSNMEHLEYLMSQYKKWALIEDRLKSVDLLIIDEISMIRSDTLNLINFVWMTARHKRDKAFGGVKVILSGDFMQLPPVVTKKETVLEPWAFQSYTWKNSSVLNFGLSKIWRQEDLTFLRLLNDLRFGYCSRESDEILLSKTATQFKEKPIILMSTNSEVDRINKEEFDKVSGETREFVYSSDGPHQPSEQLLIKECLAPNFLRLKIGCRVMALKNDSSDNFEYVNGSMGTVIGFSGSGYPKVELDSGKTIVFEEAEWTVRSPDNKPMASYKQVPLRLAYAVTIHKSQGMTLDNVEIDCANIFAPGQAYVALSRVKSLEGLRLLNWNKRVVRVDYDAVNFYKEMKNELTYEI